MASAGVGVAAASGAFVGVPYVGWAVGLAAAYIDQTVIYPMLAGDPEESRLPQLASLPSTEQGPGAPRVFALGARMRVPSHVMYQSNKAREESVGGGSKGGTDVSLKRVYVNALVHLNDRPTAQLLQLIGNGQLILFNDRNLIGVTGANLSAAVSGSNVIVSLVDEYDPDFRDTFKVGDLVMPSNFVRVAGPTTWNGKHYEVTAMAAATPTSGSTLTVKPISGESVTSLSYTGGTPFSPASVKRVDNALGGSTMNVRIDPLNYPSVRSSLVDPGVVFQPQDQVVLLNAKIITTATGVAYTTPVPCVVRDVINAGQNILLNKTFQTVAPVLGNEWSLDSNNDIEPFDGRELLLVMAADQPFTTGIFPEGFDAVANFSGGDDDQGQPEVLVSDVGSGNTSNYRGMASQGLTDFYVSAFGDQMPTNLEAILDIDEQMTWPQALEAVLQRGDLRNTQIDASSVAQRPFRGAFVRGIAPVTTQLQPLLVAGQILTQDRAGVLCLFDVDNADSVQLENGAALSDLGARTDGQQMPYDKVQMEDKPEADMPTSIGLRFQDPDAAYAIGFEHFGLRNPEGTQHVNEQVMDLSSIVLTRREARNLTTTLMRRAWINRRTYRFTLPAAYLHLLENDLVTWTDDEGTDIVARIIQRDIGANFLVNVTAVAEQTDIAVAGSPVQTSSTIVPQSTPSPALVSTLAIDAPATSNAEVTTPGLRLAVTLLGGTLQTATIYESQDGNSYLPVGSIADSAAFALTLGTLSAQTASEEYGTSTVSLRSQTVDVYWVNQGTDTIEACTQAQAEAGKNWCAITNVSTGAVEIAAFTTVTDNGDQTFTLGGWLRGLRGTSPIAQASGSSIVLLNQSTGGLFFREFAGPTPTTLKYKVVPSGADLATVDELTVSSPAFRNVLPLPVRYATKAYVSASAVTRFMIHAGPGTGQSPVHWERAVLPLGTQPPHTLDEPYEGYRIKFYRDGAFDVQVDSVLIEADPSTGSNTLRDRFFDWPDARATAAGYTPGSSETYYIGVQQIGQHGDSPEAQFIV
ncbi:MAG: hypothetical protein CMF19_07360 [Idiomarinaceae bacterium]|nr:hypothetical protein [Idiomarinaceae bacterium]